MPKGTKVHDMYSAMVREGYDEKSAAKIAQSRTGMSLVTGKPPKSKRSPKRKRYG